MPLSAPVRIGSRRSASAQASNAPARSPWSLRILRHQVVRVGEPGIPAQASARHLARGLELAPAPQRLAQLQEREARRLVGQPCRQGADVVSHGSAPAPSPASPPARRMRSTAGARASSPGVRGPSRAQMCQVSSASAEPAQRRLADAEQPARLRHQRVVPEQLLQRAGGDLVLAVRQASRAGTSSAARSRPASGSRPGAGRIVQHDDAGRGQAVHRAGHLELRAPQGVGEGAQVALRRPPPRAPPIRTAPDRAARRAVSAPAGAAPGRGASTLEPMRDHSSSRRAASMSSASVGIRTGASTAAWQGGPPRSGSSPRSR